MGNEIRLASLAPVLHALGQGYPIEFADRTEDWIQISSETIFNESKRHGNKLLIKSYKIMLDLLPAHNCWECSFQQYLFYLLGVCLW